VNKGGEGGGREEVQGQLAAQFELSKEEGRGIRMQKNGTPNIGGNLSHPNPNYIKLN
jgi:hypothetical protein